MNKYYFLVCFFFRHLVWLRRFDFWLLLAYPTKTTSSAGKWVSSRKTNRGDPSFSLSQELGDENWHGVAIMYNEPRTATCTSTEYYILLKPCISEVAVHWIPRKSGPATTSHLCKAGGRHSEAMPFISFWKVDLC